MKIPNLILNKAKKKKMKSTIRCYLRLNYYFKLILKVLPPLTSYEKYSYVGQVNFIFHFGASRGHVVHFEFETHKFMIYNIDFLFMDY